MAASAETLGALHGLFAQYLTGLLAPIIDDEGNEVVPQLPAGHLAVIAKFLKDNNISAIDDEDDDVRDLKEQLRNRAVSRGFDLSDVEVALGDAAFAEGVH